jgi:hypothetical protein
MTTILITKQFTAGALNGNIVTEQSFREVKDIPKIGDLEIDYITEIPYIVINVKECCPSFFTRRVINNNY